MTGFAIKISDFTGHLTDFRVLRHISGMTEHLGIEIAKLIVSLLSPLIPVFAPVWVAKLRNGTFKNPNSRRAIFRTARRSIRPNRGKSAYPQSESHD